MTPLCCKDLITIFNRLFEHSQNTVLMGGGAEPVYLPPDIESPLNRIMFTQDFYASALHEVAHWCIAGKLRCQQVDYGYWYKPDGRDATWQQTFEQVEIKPQALEWLFSVAAGSNFHVSQDNLSAGAQQTQTFAVNIYQQALRYLENGLPAKAEIFRAGLLAFYGHSPALAGRSALVLDAIL